MLGRSDHDRAGVGWQRQHSHSRHSRHPVAAEQPNWHFFAGKPTSRLEIALRGHGDKPFARELRAAGIGTGQRQRGGAAIGSKRRDGPCNLCLDHRLASALRVPMLSAKKEAPGMSAEAGMADIGAWLEDLGLGRYADTFTENDIDLDVLADLSEQDLLRLGMSLGDRKRLMRAIAALTAAEPDAMASSSTADAERASAAARDRSLRPRR